MSYQYKEKFDDEQNHDDEKPFMREEKHVYYKIERICVHAKV